MLLCRTSGTHGGSGRRAWRDSKVYAAMNSAIGRWDRPTFVWFGSAIRLSHRLGEFL